MKTLKKKNLTGYAPVDSKLVLGYNLFDSINDNASIVEDILQMDKEIEAKRILCDYFHYRELKFSENIFVSDYYDLPIAFSIKNHEPSYLHSTIHAPKEHAKLAREHYQTMIYFEISTKTQTFWDNFYSFILKATFIMNILILISYPLIKELIIPVTLIVNIGLKNLITNMKTLSDMELENNSIET